MDILSNKVDMKVISSSKYKKCLWRIIFRTLEVHVDEVVSFLKRNSHEKRTPKKSLLSAVSAYNKNRMFLLRIEGFQRPVLVTNFNQVQNDYFCDPHNKILFQFDHQSKVAISVHEWHMDANVEKWCKMIDYVFKDYVQAYYKNGYYNVFGSKENDTFCVTVCVKEKRMKNYSCACWRSVWNLVIASCAPYSLLKGSVQVESFFSESGNSYMTSDRIFCGQIAQQDEYHTAINMLKLVIYFEEKFKISILDFYSDVSENLKSIRRRKPLNKTGMNWNLRVGQALDLTLGTLFSENFVYT